MASAQPGTFEESFITAVEREIWQAQRPPYRDLLEIAGWDPQLAAADGAARHDVTAPGVMICAPALRAKSAPNSAPGVNAPGST